jgi:hypothetical protein
MRTVRGLVAIALGLGLCSALSGCSDSSTSTPKSGPLSSTEMKNKMQNMMTQQQKENLAKQRGGNADDKAGKADDKPKDGDKP